MRFLIFWDSITEWYYDFEKWGWANRLKTYFWKQNNNTEVWISWISGDEVLDIINRFDITTKSFVEKYSEEKSFVFAVWINDSVTNIDDTKNRNTLEEFKQNLETLIKQAKKYNPKYILFVWLTKVNEELVSPFPLSTTWKCYKNNRIKQFDAIIESLAKENNCWYIEMFDLLENKDLEDWLHPNSNWHYKIFERILDYLDK